MEEAQEQPQGRVLGVEAEEAAGALPEHDGRGVGWRPPLQWVVPQRTEGSYYAGAALGSGAAQGDQDPSGSVASRSA
jgi:hypothetical protein